MFPNELSAETRQRLAHDVDHRFGRPPIPPIVEKGERKDLTVYRRDVPSQRNDIISGTRFGVQVSLRRGVSHTVLEEL